MLNCILKHNIITTYLQTLLWMHFILPFVILSLPALQCYDHFNDKRQKEKSQQPVIVIFLRRHPPDPEQRDEDE